MLIKEWEKYLYIREKKIYFYFYCYLGITELLSILKKNNKDKNAVTNNNNNKFILM